MGGVMTEPSTALAISGALSQKDIKRLTSAMRGSSIGPTTLYYAGVTAPVIGAGMALLTSGAFELTTMSAYWRTMLSAIIAAMAGIVWYIIFMRWAYRHRHGRAGETEQNSDVSLTDTLISVRRGPVETRIDWSALSEIIKKRRFVLLRFDGADPLIVPDSWFKDKAARQEFLHRLEEGMA